MTLRQLLAQRSGVDPNKTLTNKKIEVAGFPVIVEYPKGSTRTLKDSAGRVVYSKHMLYDYGYFKGTDGRDGDEVDAIVGPILKPDEIYVVHMVDMGRDVKEREDEDKVLIGFKSADAARIAFHTMYPSNFFGGMTVLPIEDFRAKLKEAAGKKLTAGMERWRS